MIRLCQITAERFGEITAAYYQIPNLLDLQPWKLLSLVYTWCLERVPSDKLQEWITELNDPLPWQGTDSEAAANAESEAFFRAMNN